MFRAQVALLRTFGADDVWIEVSQNEYDVLYTLSKSANGMSMVEINRGILMTQAGISRLVARLETRGLLERCADDHDRRAVRMILTPEGARIQKVVGRRHASAITSTMTRALSREQLEQLRDISRTITSVIHPTHTDHESPRIHA
ncbi:MarR family transcriptional regulator [Cryobacterium sp. MDB1-18-2]|uniref:MarR family transcriptional regulator n=2 Tax=Microbacteriaceae TaxID=85023 RepID=A0ABY2IRJ7_9MICO|nr:MarR family transcriptional regulator [Cryobacterium sp. MDB2-A-1]TFC04294.1 MarR family transcriptional regulator [Cryobacterium sp. MDB2-33-2]TFC14983.1 MarR family transcriptional regulator [Cryobacterium sp. MDB2-A-2]TFC16466.1 MarR family transcriptional regulator [Cryobacterium sp. MDB2-10]TFC21194.1 MarR family transcriptional regulator [Cryobacterium glucosi]TFC22889.1 MarR family transcriptional regulator [Cryobacterium sp. MDB1-18-2]TFC42745.1 MarR family transcriptional regulato